MSIYEYLVNKYGSKAVDGIMSCILMHDAVRHNIFNQWIHLSEYNEYDKSSYKIALISKLKELFNGNIANEISSILGVFDSKIKKYNTAITYGTFDLFHIGHLNLLNRIKSYCNNLIVAVSTDEFNSIKGKKCVIPYADRLSIVKSIKSVDLAIPEVSWEQKINDIHAYNVNAFFIGDDWSGKFDYLNDYCDVIYLPRTEGISTTQLKSEIGHN